MKMSPLHGKRDCADANKLRTLRWRIILHYSVSGIHIRSGRPNLITKVLIREKAMWRWKQIKDVTLLALKMKKRPWTKEYKSTVVEARKGKERKFPLDPLKNQWNPLWTSDLQNREVINLYCFKLWQLATAAVEN